MESDDRRIMARRILARALLEQTLRIAVRQPQLGQALERDQPKDDEVERQAASSISPAQVKPGPNAVIITLSGSPLFRSRSSTNMTVGALMLPKSFSTSRSRLSSPWLSFNAL